MKYINALELIKKAIELSIFGTQDNLVFVKREINKEEKWVLQDMESLAQELMVDEKGQKLILRKILKKDPHFKLKDYSYIDKIPKGHMELYLMVWVDETESWTYYMPEDVLSESELDVAFPNGYVAYYIGVSVGIIEFDDYSEDRVGKNFKEIYGIYFNRDKES